MASRKGTWKCHTKQATPIQQAKDYEGNDNVMEGINDRWKQWRKEAQSNKVVPPE